MPALRNTPEIMAFNFKADGLELSGRLHLPAADRFAVVIGSHGLLSDARSPKQLALAEACCRRHIAYLRFDHRGCGRSQGDFCTDTTLAGRVADLAAAAHAVARVPGADGRIALFGSSLGGSVCMAAAPRLKPVALVLFAAPLRSRTIARPADTRPALGNELELDFDLSGGLHLLDHLLVIHGTADAVVPVEDAREIYAGAGHPKRLWLQSGGDHPMSDPAHQTRFINEAVAWIVAALGAAGRGLDSGFQL